MMKKKIIWHNHFDNGNYIINATSGLICHNLYKSYRSVSGGAEKGRLS